MEDDFEVKLPKSPCKQCVTYTREITSGVKSGDGSVGHWFRSVRRLL